jgi:hypothetical protein
MTPEQIEEVNEAKAALHKARKALNRLLLSLEEDIQDAPTTDALQILYYRRAASNAYGATDNALQFVRVGFQGVSS